MSIQKVIEKMKNDGVFKLTQNLYGRWLCEKEYEDIKTYQEAIQFAAPYITITKMTKRPFGFTFKTPAYAREVKVTVKSKGNNVILNVEG